MQPHCIRSFACCRFAAVSLVACFAALNPAFAADDALERERLVAITRQFDQIDLLIEQAADAAPHAHVRYHFDYERLRADLTRVRAGVQDYLAPQRAQPRDPLSLFGEYTRSDAKAEASR